MKKFRIRIIKLASNVLFFSIITINLNAQSGQVGLRFMPTFSKFDIKTSTGGTIKGEGTFGLGFGAFMGYSFSEYIGIQGEMIYSSYSQKYQELQIEREVKLKYINIPLLITLNTGKSRAVNLNVVAGPQIGISVGSDLFTTGDDGTGSQGVLSIKKGDLGFAYGAGLDFGLNPARNIRLGIGYRGVVGVFDISDNNSTIQTNSFYVLEKSHVKVDAAYIGLSFVF
ncbi:MAG: PorT family protein [Lewinellaceae bacterium]|nr:PorT family protein [Lewinellaceae bacterium]